MDTTTEWSLASSVGELRDRIAPRFLLWYRRLKRDGISLGDGLEQMMHKTNHRACSWFTASRMPTTVSLCQTS